ncbi:MAG: protoporphyrinogen/coproporphyrinogen oxidase [Acidimicrobiia bacterium]
MTARVIMLGAGPAGLAFAYRYGTGATILEKGRVVGGLSRSIELFDGIFDVGGHSFHTPDLEVRQLVEDLMGEDWHEQPRDARVWFRGEVIPYPFQHHYEQLADRKLVEGFRQFNPDPACVAGSKNFDEWIQNRFGPELSRHFMLPYNRKLWAHDLKTMSCDWVGERVATERAHTDPSTSLAPERRPLQPDSRVAYPKEGGFGAIFEALARKCSHVELGENVVRIDLKDKIVTSQSGESWQWDKLVSTMPLPMLLATLTTCPERLRRMAADLRAVSLKIVMLLVRRPETDPPQRIYVADHGIPAHKIAFNHMSSPALSARSQHAIMCEVSYSETKPPLPERELIDAMTAWLESAGYLATRDHLIAS